MLIDVHAHQFTPGMMDRDKFWGPSFKRGGLTVGHWVLRMGHLNFATDAEANTAMLAAMTPESKLKLMDEQGVEKVVFSTPSHAFMYWGGAFGDEYAWICNEELAGFVKHAPDRFDFWAHANLANPKEAVKQLDHAVRNLGAKGLCCGGANFNGLEAHSEELFPVWEKLVELNVPVMVHGYNQSIWWGEKHTDDKFDTTSIVGDCTDETLFFWYLINGGALDVFPKLKTYVSHAGGLSIFQLGRLDSLNQSMSHDRRNKRRVMDYMDNFYFDLDVHSVALRQAIIAEVGVDRLLYGTNFGGAYSNGDLTEGLGLSDADRNKIRSDNAISLLKLDVRQPAAA
jgi:aminocarboxymuconate-semialdehyde decarboxylase